MRIISSPQVGSESETIRMTRREDEGQTRAPKYSNSSPSQGTDLFRKAYSPTESYVAARSSTSRGAPEAVHLMLRPNQSSNTSCEYFQWI